MKKSVALVVFVFLPCCLCFAEVWEYQVLFLPDHEFRLEIQKLGLEGWEIASSRRASSDEHGYGYEIIFKRKKPIVESEAGLKVDRTTIILFVSGAFLIILFIFLVIYAVLLNQVIVAIREQRNNS